jgi:hypothetical protein
VIFTLTAALAFAASLVANGPARAGTEDAFATRTAMAAIDKRCRLFEPGLKAALSMARVQARNASLRAGVSASRLQAIELDIASRSASLSCSDPAVTAEAAKVRSAFAAYGRILRLDFPGRFGGWKADRTVLDTRQDAGRWALKEGSAAPAGARLGLLAYKGRTVLFAAAGGATGAASARLVLRNPTLAPDPYLPGKGLTAPPRSVSDVYYGASRIAAPDGGEGFTFSDAAAQALAQLDPREPVTVEFVHPASAGDRIEKVVFEVGDFAPAAAFIALGR